MRVGIVMKQIIGHRFRHNAGDLRAAGAVKISGGKTVVSTSEGGKLCPNFGSRSNLGHKCFW